MKKLIKLHYTNQGQVFLPIHKDLQTKLGLIKGSKFLLQTTKNDEAKIKVIKGKLSFDDYFELHKSELESAFLENVAPEIMPFDDDIPDFLQMYAVEIEDFARERYNKLINKL